MAMTSPDAIYSFSYSQDRRCTVTWDRHAANWRSRSKRVDSEPLPPPVMLNCLFVHSSCTL